MRYFIKGLKNYLNFKDRSTRKDYWYFELTSAIIMLCFFLINLHFIRQDNPLAALSLVLTYLYVISVIIPSVALAIRRLHDLNRPFPWIFIPFIPVIGWILFLGLLVMDGTKGPNNYGPDPKGRPGPTQG